MLSDALLLELHDAAVSAGLDRDALLTLVDRHFVAAIPLATSPAEQLLVDLRCLRDGGVLPTGASPLLAWLSAAKTLTRHRSWEAVFAGALVAATGGAHAQATSLDPMLPGAPELFVGRTADVEGVKRSLRISLGAEEDRSPRTRLLVSVRGMPGVGKTALARALAHDREINERFSDGVLWWTLGTSPQLESDLARWGRVLLGTDHLYSRSSLREITARLAESIGGRKILVVADDVWRSEHADVVRRALGPRCALLVTTRSSEIAHTITGNPDAIHVVPTLKPADALDLLDRLAPRAVRDETARCERLLGCLGYLPLAIHVAGRMLARESAIGSVRALLDDLSYQPEGRAMLLDANVPLDGVSLQDLTSPTVRATLSRSVDFLSDTARERLAFLAGLEGPLSLENLAALWEAPDPLPTVRELLNLGLVEPLGGGEVQIHALVSALAHSLCTEDEDAGAR